MLPRSVNGAEKASESSLSSARDSSVPIKIWLVDNNRRLRTMLAELFGQFKGIECTATFHSPNAVLSALASKAGPDVLLLDVHMGEANGLEAIHPIKSLSRSTQVLMLTTFFDHTSKTRAMQAGASGFLLKSFPAEEILASIQQAAKHPAPHRKHKPRQTLGEVPGAGKRSTQTPPKRYPENLRTKLPWVKKLVRFASHPRQHE
jgi:DNA-binding NarL/FixJ family response regulator